VTVRYAGQLTGAEVLAKAIPSLIDEIPILALVAAGGGQRIMVLKNLKIAGTRKIF
jgi:hypothetical protein